MISMNVCALCAVMKANKINNFSVNFFKVNVLSGNKVLKKLRTIETPHVFWYFDFKGLF